MSKPTTSKEKIIDRVRKLLARAKSDNPHEAALAAAMAAELQLEHQIAEAEIEDAAEVEPITEESVDATGKLVSWKGQILMGLVGAFGCEAYQVVGTPSSIDTIKYMYQYLCAETVRLADVGYGDEVRECDLSGVSRPSARAWKGSFRVGCAGAIRDRLLEQRKKTMDGAKAAGKSTALQRIDDQRLAVKSYIKSNVGPLRKGGRSYAGQNRSGRAAGRVAGQSVGLGGSSRGAISAGAKRLGGGK